MRHIVTAAIVGAALGWSLLRPAAEPAGIDEKVRAVAAGMAAITPKTMDHGVVLRSVHADGSTLVIQIDGISDWHPTYTNDEMARMLGASICTRPGIPTMISEGAKLKFDPMARDGLPLPSLTIDHCA